jgi:hypothetical protein
MLKNIRSTPDIAAWTSAGLVRSPTMTLGPVGAQRVGTGVVVVHHGANRLAPI